MMYIITITLFLLRHYGFNAMSRSRRKMPIVGITLAESDKSHKVTAHRAERRSVRAIIASCLDQDDRRLYAKVYGDPWCSPKDGKVFTSDPRDLRK